ncbi:MAG: M48 family metalloprotease [Phormidesmis sp. RL_2_1]|nr:M48 family metalloprotease [Phormidesmis sp. RL_2_1]
MSSATDWERLLQAGMNAYQAGKYEQAIAALSQLSRTRDRTYRLKARMGLVRTYMAQKKWAKAQAICQKMSQSPKPSIRQWAALKLTKIESAIGQSVSAPILPAAPVIPQVAPQATPPHIPLSNSPSSLPENLSGFQPLEHRAQEPSAVSLASSENNASEAISMFHYAYLNREEFEQAQPQPDEQTAHQQPEQAHPKTQQQTHQQNHQQTHQQAFDWVYAGRLKQGKRLGRIKKGPLWVSLAAGVVAFYTFLLCLMHSVSRLINVELRLLDRLLPFWVRQLPEAYGDLAWPVLGGLVLWAIASPWLWDRWLSLTANQQPFSNQQLRVHSPEAATYLGKQCRQQHWPFPTLWMLPTEIPLIFSYGWLPRNARLVVSSGLLAQLEADEIATLVSYEMAHWQSGHWLFLSTLGLVLQLFHQLYWQISLWGNRQALPISAVAGVLANLSYCLFWLARISGLWPSRVRTYYGDRTATEHTGNPNGLARALSKLSLGIAASIEHQGYTPAVVESLALMLPVSADVTRQSLHSALSLEQRFAWDSLNPLRHWMSLNHAHPPLGDRLRLIMAYAQHWRLHLEIQLISATQRPQHNRGLSPPDWIMLIRQGTPFFGLALGLGIGLSLLLIGAIAHHFQQTTLDWMHQDIALFKGCLFMGFGVGIMLRINRFFPDLSFHMPSSPTLLPWISNPALLPVSSLPAKLSGTLMGRPGIANWLGQDILFKLNPEKPDRKKDSNASHHGLLKLHFFSILGPLGNVFTFGSTSGTLLGKPAHILGWFRPSAQPWLDIDTIRLGNGTSVTAAHPLYSLLIAIMSCGYALWLLGLGQMWQEIWDKIAS